MIGLALIILSLLFAFVGPFIIPYKYDEQVRGFENLLPMQTPQERKTVKDEQVQSPKTEVMSLHMILIHHHVRKQLHRKQLAVELKEAIFPHVLGTDSLGRDNLVRLMYGSRISLLVGIIASVIILIIGSIYGAFSGFIGGKDR